MSKPERFTTVPPGCCIELAKEVIGSFLWVPQYRAFGWQKDGCRLAIPWPVLRPSADNKYGCLPFDIPIPEGYEPDGEWEPGEGEKAAFRKVAAGDTFIDKCGSGLVAFADSRFNAGSESRLCVRRIKTRRTVVEVEIDGSIPLWEGYRIGEWVTISCKHLESIGGTITAVREVER